MVHSWFGAHVDLDFEADPIQFLPLQLEIRQNPSQENGVDYIDIFY